MFKAEVDPRVLLAKFSDLEQRQLPYAIVGALNDALFDARDAWRNNIASVFDNPNQLTMNAVLYRKATRERMDADLFLRNEASKGTPPSRYLLAQVEGKAREEKPFEHLLREAGVLGSNEFVTPARGFPLDPFGNVPVTLLSTILADLQAHRDVTRRSTAESRTKRGRRRNIGKRSIYFYSRGPEDIGGGKIQHLPRGIYQRTGTGFGSSVRLVLVIVEGAPVYRSRFHAFDIANKAFAASFPVRFRERLREGVATAKIK